MKARLALLGALLAALAACTADPAAPGGGGVLGGPAAAGDSDVNDVNDVDACTLLTDAEIEEVLGTFRKQPQGLTCSWENTDDYHSVTVRVGTANTARGDELPAESPYGPTEPGPDGTRYAPGNVIEFAADGRACEIQVVTSVSDDSDRPKAAEFAALVRERLG